jgi:hypothetical protein
MFCVPIVPLTSRVPNMIGKAANHCRRKRFSTAKTVFYGENGFLRHFCLFLVRGPHARSIYVYIFIYIYMCFVSWNVFIFTHAFSIFCIDLSSGSKFYGFIFLRVAFHNWAIFLYCYHLCMYNESIFRTKLFCHWLQIRQNCWLCFCSTGCTLIDFVFPVNTSENIRYIGNHKSPNTTGPNSSLDNLTCLLPALSCIIACVNNAINNKVRTWLMRR